MPLGNVEGLDLEPRRNSYDMAMLDLETLGVESGAAILSVGLVCFDLDGPDRAASLHLGISKPLGKIEIGTTMWWMQQSDDARKRIVDVTNHGDTELIVCASIKSMVEVFGIKELWSNGPSFDERLLHEMFDRNHQVGKSWPFRHNAGRDCRTIFDIGATLNVPWIEREGVGHDALDDAIHQANNVAAILRHLRGLPR